MNNKEDEERKKGDEGKEQTDEEKGEGKNNRY